MRIDSIVADPAPPGQLVIGQGDGLDVAHKLLFGDKPGLFECHRAGDIEAEVPRDSGTVELTIELVLAQERISAMKTAKGGGETVSLEPGTPHTIHPWREAAWSATLSITSRYSYPIRGWVSSINSEGSSNYNDISGQGSGPARSDHGQG